LTSLTEEDDDERIPRPRSDGFPVPFLALFQKILCEVKKDDATFWREPFCFGVSGGGNKWNLHGAG
jgi:hypothetical protein